MARVCECSSLTAGYGSLAVVHGIDLHIEEGEIVALLGANGAGKSTTMATIAGIRKPLGGQVTVVGADVANTAPHVLARRGLRMVPEHRGLFGSLTVAENLRLGLARHRDRFDDVFEHFPALARLQHQRAAQLSGGEQQMLALGRAILGKPRLLLADEMSLGLAPIIVARILPVLRHLADSSGCAVLLVEQHVGMALEVADRGYVLQQGEVVLEGTSSDLAKNRELMESSYLG